MPIVAVLIPYGIRYFWPEHKLEFGLVGPISTEHFNAMQLKISNNGGKLEKDVKVWLKRPVVNAIAKSYRFYQDEDRKKFLIDSLSIASNSQCSVTTEGDNYVISVGDIRPKETVELSIAARDVKFFVSCISDRCINLVVKSDEHVAGFMGQSIFEELLYPVGFWLFVILMGFLLVIGLYQQYFMSYETREKMILEAIDKLKK